MENRCRHQRPGLDRLLLPHDLKVVWLLLISNLPLIEEDPAVNNNKFRTMSSLKWNRGALVSFKEF
jgi:hypothetical protein